VVKRDQGLTPQLYGPDSCPRHVRWRWVVLPGSLGSQRVGWSEAGRAPYALHRYPGAKHTQQPNHLYRFSPTANLPGNLSELPATQAQEK
jgi:hypothetical protein